MMVAVPQTQERSRPISRGPLSTVREAAPPPAVRLLAEDPKLRELIGRVIKKLLSLTSAVGAGLCMVDGDEVAFLFTQGVFVEGQRLALAGTPLDACVRARQTVRLDRLTIALTTTEGPRPELGTTIVIPVCPGEQVLGLVVLTAPGQATFSADEVETAEMLAELINAGFGTAVDLQMSDALLVDLGRAMEGWGQSSTVLQSFFATAPLLMGVVVLQGDDVRYQELNPAAARWLGMASKDAIDKPIAGSARTLVPPEVLRACAEAAQTGQAVRVEHAALDSSGGMHHFVTSVAALSLSPESARQFCVVTDEVTANVEMRAQLQVSDRLASLGTLAAGIAHEINNPLSYIRANLDYSVRELSEPAVPLDEIREALIEARDGVERMARIVRDLKTVSHPGGPDTVAVDPVDAVSTAVRVATGEVTRRAMLRTDFGAMPRVRGASHSLVQVILNLLLNAAQAIPGGRAEDHEIVVRTSTDSRGWAQIEVSDTGVGIPEEIQRKVFDPFFTTKAVGVGTGLGLSICHGIVARLGGDLSFRSELGRGTTFRVVLPPAVE